MSDEFQTSIPPLPPPDAATERAASSSRKPDPLREPPLANPWIWVGAGLSSCVMALPFTTSDPDAGSSPILQGVLISLGLLLVGVGVTIRLNSSSPPFAQRWGIVGQALLGLVALVQLLTAALACWCVIAAFMGIDPLSPNSSSIDTPPPLRPGLAILLWTLFVPMSLAGAKQVVDGLRRDKWSTSLETAALLTFTALATFLSGFALAYAAPSLAFFLGVSTAFLVGAISYVTLTLTFRRLVLSAVILLHFAAISNATMAAPPSPWLMGQLWARFSRPYLEFMYLNNAYHFYAPDPGPASFVWFRIYYDTGEKDPANGQPILQGEWLKIPDVDENGHHKNHVALEYQRHLSLTENVVRSDASPPFFTTTPQGAVPAPFFYSRIINSPEGPALQKQEVVGQRLEARFVMEVPFHVALPRETQFQPPNLDTKRMIESYVRHVAKRPHSRHPEWPVSSIRVYRATHAIPLWNDFVNDFSPHDLELYRPFYLGRYAPNGDLIDPDEPLLYWLLPMERLEESRESRVKSYAVQHAGDPNYVYDPVQKKWTPWVAPAPPAALPAFDGKLVPEGLK